MANKKLNRLNNLKKWFANKWLEVQVRYDESNLNPRYLPVGTAFYLIILLLGVVPFLFIALGIIKVQGGFFIHFWNVSFTDSISLLQFYFSVLTYFVGSYAVWQFLKSFNRKIKPVLDIMPAKNVLDNRNQMRKYVAMLYNAGNTAIKADELRYEIFFADGIEVGIDSNELANMRRCKKITNTDLVPLPARINKHNTNTQIISGTMPEKVHPQESAILFMFEVKNNKSVSGNAYYYFSNDEQYFPKNTRINNSYLTYYNLAKEKISFYFKK